MLAAAALLLVGAADAAPGSAAAADQREWSRALVLELSAGDLGLPAGTPATRLARAALARKAALLGLRGATLRLDGRLHVPRIDGARPFDRFRFQQRAGSLRVVWSQVDVTVVAGRVTSISATVVPVERGPAAGDRSISRGDARRIALRAVGDAEGALAPLAAAYAGNPTRARGVRSRTARRVWVVEVERPPAPGDEAPSPLCVVVDSETGKVIARWPGIADRPERGPRARGATGRGPSAARDGRELPATAVEILDGTSTTNPAFAPAYATFNTTGDARVSSSWPSYQSARVAALDPDLEAASANVANVARTICVVRGWCGSRGGFQPGTFKISSWVVVGDVPDALGSKAFIADLHVQIADQDLMGGNGDPNLPFNDVVAHELGHVMDWVYAGDRTRSPTRQVQEVEEALADMFAYDYDRGDATWGEDRLVGERRNWADPDAKSECSGTSCVPYPDHMSEYEPVPPGAQAGHFNSTILSHAYFRFVQAVGHDRAGRVLHNVPSALGPQPTFDQASVAFYMRAGEVYGGTVDDAAAAAFSAVGLNPLAIIARDSRRPLLSSTGRIGGGRSPLGRPDQERPR